MKINLTAKQVRERFSISEMTLWNWRHDEKMDFPKAMKIRKRNYFDRDEIEAFEAKMIAKAGEQNDTETDSCGCALYGFHPVC